MTWRSASGVGATALCALLVAGPAAALDIKVWPLFRYARTPDGSVRWSALGPLLEYRRTPDATDLWLRPLLSVHRQRAPERAGEAHILFPLATVRWRDDSRSARFLLFTWRSEPHERRFSLFPLVYWRSDAEGRRLAVLPFYLDLPDFLGYERVTAVLFPAWVRLREPGVERTFYGFPFVSTVGGALGRGFRVWPFFGTKEIVGRERTRYVLWPFHIRREELVPGYGWDRIRVNFPVFAARDGEGIRSRGWGMLAYTSTVDERRGYEAYGSPWPFVVRERPLGAESWRTWRAAPIYGRTDTEGYHARFYGWPGYRWRHESSADVDNERRDFLWFFWRHQRRWTAGGQRGRPRHPLPALPPSDRERPRRRAGAGARGQHHPGEPRRPRALGATVGRGPLGHWRRRLARLESSLGPAGPRARTARRPLPPRSTDGRWRSTRRRLTPGAPRRARPRRCRRARRAPGARRGDACSSPPRSGRSSTSPPIASASLHSWSASAPRRCRSAPSSRSSSA